MESRLTLPVYAEIEITERPVTPECLGLLSDEQLARAARFTKTLRRNQHIWARVLIRLLAEKLYPDIPRHAIQIVEDPPRAPRIVLPGGVLRTSITHSGSRVACLIDSEICAADLEKIDLSRPLLRYADVAFNHETAARVKAEPDIGTVFSGPGGPMSAPSRRTARERFTGKITSRGSGAWWSEPTSRTAGCG